MRQKDRRRLEQSIAALKERLPLDSNDLDYETHLHVIRTLQRLLDRDGQGPAEISEKNHGPGAE